MEYWSDLYKELAGIISGGLTIDISKNKGIFYTEEELFQTVGEAGAWATLSRTGTSNSFTYVWEPEKETWRKLLFRWIDLWHQQTGFLTVEHPFPTPAVFIGFRTLEIREQSLLIQDCTVQIDFHVFYETFSDTYEGAINQGSALEFLDLLTELHVMFHGRNGKNFSEMNRIDLQLEDSGGSGNLYRISFKCVVNDESAMKKFKETTGNEVDVIRAKNIERKKLEMDLYHTK